MRTALVAALAVVGARSAHAEGPLRINVICEDEGRTKVCPAFVRGFIDARPVLRAAPRADADVVLYVNATAVARQDRVHLRFVGAVRGAPPVIELDAEVDSRADDDAQRAQLEPAFLRGIALFAAARDPRWVTVDIGGEAGPAAPAQGGAYDAVLDFGGFASWTERYRAYNGAASLTLAQTTSRQRVAASAFASGGVTHQPPLIIEGARAVSLDSAPWQLGASLVGARLATAHWSYGAGSRLLRDDPKGAYSHQWITRGAVEWDRFSADDPRGNRLAILYTAGWESDGYRLRNTLGERAASYPIHGLIASGAVRRDALTIGLQLQATGELLHPERRHSISATPSLEWRLGAHVDLRLAWSITKRELPAVDPAEIAGDDFAQLSRLSYAEPLAMTGSFGLTLHLDRTNAARNDRLSDL